MPRNRRPLEVQIADHEAMREALELRLAGLPYREIAERQGCTVGTAHGRVRRALAALVPADKAEELREVENERLNLAVNQCLEVIARAQDNPDAVLAAVGRLTKVSERIAKLNGLDIPVVQKVEVTTVDNLDEQIEQLMEELGRSGEGATT